jgi:hypothetical protein
MAELILVTVLCWIVFDPVLVITHDLNLPMGYDADRLCLIKLSCEQEGNPLYHEEDQDSAALVNALFQLTAKAATFEGVERTAPLLGYLFPGSQGNGYTFVFAAGDTIPENVGWMEFIPHTGFFETYGFRPGIGRTLEELSDYPYTGNEMVITEDLALKLFHTKDVRNCNAGDGAPGDSAEVYPIVGAIGAFKYYAPYRPLPSKFYPQTELNEEKLKKNAQILVRLKEGVNKQQFLTQFRNWMPTEMRRGNLFARRVISYEQLLDSTTNSEAMPKLRRGYLSALFFLVNLCLGVIGTFWLQTRSRREEVGVLLSFGGTPGYVIRVLLGEGVLLTLVSSLIGHAGYLTYLHFWGEGFTKSFSLNEVRYLDSSWLDTFSTHALGEAGIITAILLVVVLIGVYIPARAASRVNPVEALRDE